MEIRVAIADDHPVTFLGIREVLKNNPNFIIVNYSSNGNLLYEFLKKEPTDILIMDIDMPELNGIDFLKKHRSEFPKLKILLYTMHEGEGYFRDALRYGIQGYLIKTDPLEYLNTILQKIMDGEFYYSSVMKNFILPSDKQISPKESEILDYLVKGFKFIEIGQMMNISPRTVEYYSQKLKERFEAESIVHLVNIVKKDYYK
jgi:DNA-binding NarL/FixJ family response regulator